MWHEDGRKWFVEDFKKHKRHGKVILWNANGKKDEERNYINGDLVGKTIFKYSFFTGRLKSKKIYKDGKCISGDC